MIPWGAFPWLAGQQNGKIVERMAMVTTAFGWTDI